MTTFESIRELIVAQVAERAGVSPAAIVPTQRFTQLGLNSLGAMGMLAALGAALGRPVLSTMAWEHPTPESLARHLAGGADPADAGAEPALRGGSDEPIAVIGMACRFPQAASPEAFWALLSGGVDAITEVPADRWDIEAIYDADPAAPGKMNTRWGGFLSSVDTFDAGFFGISPREAAQIDPQQRLALELAWEALEDAGIVPAALKDSRTGVFFGAMWMDYARLAAAGRQPIVQHTATGQDLGVVAARVSYTLGLLGPSLTVNTACSSSLVAVHLACQSLLRGESRFALAGALNLMLAPEGTVTMSKFGAMAPDGRSKAFDARANGYVRGEGGGVVALKRLGDAVADGDRVYCVIRGSAVNNDGFSNGLTAPSPRAQQAVVRDACAAAGVAPGDVQYVETHGTGTLLGDPIEAGALGAVLGAGRSAERALRIGSVKTNIGHLEAAAGMAGLIKVVLSMHHRALPPSLHFQTPNPHIAFAALGLRVQTALEPWEGDGVRLLAGVSSFGFGGTNSHVVLEAPAAESARLVVLSAEDEAGLQAQASELAAQVRTGTGPALAGVSGASLCRAWQAWRLAVVVRSRAELGAHLDAFGGGQVFPGASVGRAASPAPRVVFMFGGQGSQWQGMGRALLAEPAPRAMLERCDRALRPYVQWSLVERLSGGGAELLDQTDFVQPALFAMQLALCEAWRARGVTPDAVIGQSLGEVAAACVAGGLSVEDGVRVMCTRSQLVLRAMDDGRLLRGGMAVVELSLAATEEAIAAHGGALSVAVSSGPETTVVAGDIAALHALVAVLQARAVFCRMVRVDYASHCAHMDPLLTELRASLAGVAPRRPAISFYSTVTAAPLDGALVDAEYWARNLREPVLFASTMARLINDGFATFVEVDPHAMLTGAVERCLAHAGRAGLVVASGQRDESEADTLLRASGRLLVAGVPVRVGAEERAMLPVLVSAQSEAGLQAQALRWAQWLEAHPEASLVEVARTAAMHRSALGQRAVVVADDVEGAVVGLRALAEGRPGPVLAVEAARKGGKLAVMFTGQGSQRPGMGRGLAAADPMFAAELRDVIAALDPHLERPLLSVMWAAEGSEEVGLLDRTDFTQPALFALEVALFRRWRQLGLRPDVVLGHSIGELAAACCVGVMSLADAARLVAARGRLMAALPEGGAMVAIAATEAELGPVLAEYAGQVELAAINGPTSCVVSGDEAAVLAVAARFADRKQRRLKVSHAFHSPAMDAMLAAFTVVARSVVFHSPTIPMVCGETGQVVDPAVLCTPEHWVRQVRVGVRFVDAMVCAEGLGASVFVEMGPQGVLCGMGAECVESAARFVPSLRAGRGEAESFALAAGTLWAVGQSLDWVQVLGKGRLAELPTTAFVRQRYWLEETARSSDVQALGLSSARHPLLGAVTRLAERDGLLFTGRLSLADQPWLADHAVFDTVLVPGTGLLELALTAARAVGEVIVSELTLAAPLVLPRRGAVRVQLQVEGPDAAGRRGLNLYSRPEDGPEETQWTRNATGVLAGATSTATARFDEELTAWPPPGAVSVDLGELYSGLAVRGYQYGPAFQGLAEVWRREDVVFARVVLPAALRESAGEYGLHPALLDAALHALVAGGEAVMLPFAFSDVVLHATGASELRVRLAPAGEGGVCLTVADGTGEPVARIGGLQLRPATAGQVRAGTAEGQALYRVDWVPVALDGAANAVMGWVLGGDGRLAEAFGLASIPDLSVLFEWLNRGEPAPARLIVDVTHMRSEEGVVQQVQVELSQALETLQAVLAEPRLSRTSLLWVTRGAVAASVDDVVPDLVRAPLWGLVRSARSEHPDRVIRLLDLDASRVPPAALGEDGEPELALRHGVVLAARLLRGEDNESTLGAPGSRDWRLNLPARGSLGDLELVVGSAAPLLAGQVRVAVHAAGMNFRDALNALGMVPAPWLGLELAGVVLEVGGGVTQLAVGDRVMGLGQGTFATTTIADARLLARIPVGLSFAEAATIPLVFLTALYALQDLAGLRAGERVLVHAAAGGVGMAAVQLALHLGAEVFGTASPGKWAVLRAMGVGHIAGSRELGFAEAFLSETRGEGVDVVLNALAGDFIEASLRLLPRGGRFLEMGKTDVRDPAAVARAHSGVTYCAFELMEAGPARIHGMLAELARLFEQGVLSPLPLCVYDLRHAPAAFKHLANGRNVGKVVLQPPRLRSVGGAGEVPLTSDTVLITGGTGELGLSLARHLVQRHGVKHLLLTSRRGVAGAVVETLQDMGAETVAVVACDVADSAALAAVLGAIPRERPLGAVFHLAGVLDDGVVTGLTGERLARVLEPKVAGTWNLHRLTAGMELQAFVLFSSVAGVMGSAGQASYAAANSFLDALVARRRSQGLAGQSLAWGPWASQGGGMTAHLGATDLARMLRQGLAPLAVAAGLGLLDVALGRPEAALVPVRLDLGRMQRGVGEGASLPALLRGLLRPALRRVGPAAIQGQALRQRLGRLSGAERRAAVLELVRGEIAAVLGLAGAAAVPPERSLQQQGLDSLMAVELRNRLATRAETTLPATLAFDYPTPEAITGLLLRQAFAEPEEAKTEPTVAPQGQGEPIAVIGMACRTPGGVSDPEGFWALLEAGRDVVGPFPARWDTEALYDPDPDAAGKCVAREGGFLDDIAGFDAPFFGISPREAAAMDPQQRLVLETAWEALERAGMAPGAMHGAMGGVYLGSLGADYGDPTDLVALDGYRGTGVASSVLSGRVAYVLGLQGPAMTVDTACSSSLVALHLAAAGLRQGDCDLALAGGVQVMCRPGMFVEFSRLRGTAPDGRCKSFSAEANGAGWAEGCGVLVLKRLSDARRDGDRVLAVLRGSAVNQDGRSQGLTAPNGPSQQRVIRRALAVSGLVPTDIDAIEAHGTGTALGDPVEAGALAEVFGPTRGEGRPLWLGSSKSNLGHAQAAAGVLGVIKMVLALQHGVLPRTLHAERPSPHIAWEGSGLRLVQAAQPWPRADGRVRRAGVSSFGVSGTNAHVILEEAPAAELKAMSTGLATLPLQISGHTEEGLRAQASRWAQWLGAHSGTPWESVLRAAALTRTHLNVRATIQGQCSAEAALALAALAEGLGHPAVSVNQSRSLGKVVFVFPGQGGQWIGMGRVLLVESPVFAGAVAACDAALRPHTGWSVEAVLRGEGPGLDRVDVVQPALFAMAVGLAAVWRSFGIEPAAVVGHSQGELAAAVVSGALSLEDGARIVAVRSQAVRRLAGSGAMAAVELPAAELEARLKVEWPGLSVAVVNTTNATVVAGDVDVVAAFVARLTSEGVFCRRVEVDYASHCGHVEPILGEIRTRLSGLSPRAAAIPMVSTVTGAVLAEGALDAEYWCRNLREPVRFDRALDALRGSGHEVFIEVSAHPVLAMVLNAGEAPGVVVGSLRRECGGLGELHRALGVLHTHGVPVDWARLFGAGSLAELPTTAFVRQRFWLEARARREDDLRCQGLPEAQPALQTPIDSAEPSAGSNLAAVLRVLPGPERRARLMALVQGEVAAVLGYADMQRVDVQRDFAEFGFDSLMAIGLRRRLEHHSGLRLPATIAFKHPTVNRLTDALAELLLDHEIDRFAGKAARDEPMTSATSWTQVWRPRPNAAVQLVCFHHAGGGASMFRSWADVIGPDIEVCAVQLPGREERRTEAPFTRLGPLLDALEQHLSPKLRGPYVYFGHSMGALVAFEFGRRQAARSMPGPAMLLLAGYRGPGAPASPAIHDLPESHLREALRRHGGTPAAVLADDAMMQVFSPLLRADFAVHEGWHYASGPRLDCPIVALAGDDDSFAPADAVEAFAAETHDRFRLHVFPGGHFFVSSARDAVLATIQAELRSAGLLAGLRRGELRELP